MMAIPPRRAAGWAAAILVVLVLVWWMVRPAGRTLHAPGAAASGTATPREPAAGLPPQAVGPLDPAVAIVLEEDSEGAFLLPGATELETRLHVEEGTARGDIAILHELLLLYGRASGGHMPLAPQNSVVVAQLRGKNEKRVAVLSAGQPNLSSEGELLDRWGTPYFFHPAASNLMEIRSAGPDRTMWTGDDVQWPEPPASENLP